MNIREQMRERFRIKQKEELVKILMKQYTKKGPRQWRLKAVRLIAKALPSHLQDMIHGRRDVNEIRKDTNYKQ